MADLCYNISQSRSLSVAFGIFEGCSAENNTFYVGGI